MDSEKFRKCNLDMVNYIINYNDNIRERPVAPDVEPGFLQKLLPSEAPQKPEPWEDIMSDVENKIMPGITHWQHPGFHAYFCNGNSYPNILADMLVDALGVNCFTWVCSPAAVELETIMCDWVGKMIGLPDDFLFYGKNSEGGGVLHASASECIFVSCLAARTLGLKRLRKKYPHENDAILCSKLVAYSSKAAHSSAEKSAFMSLVKIRLIETDDNQSMQTSLLRKVIEEDIANGLVPFWVDASLGTTSTVAFDNLLEIGPICEEFNIWLHIDASYAGAAFICPELREPLRGIEYAMSFNFNPYKWMLVTSDGAGLWVKDRYKLLDAFDTSPVYLQHDFSAAVDFKDWGIALSHKFRALKLWFVIRSYGIEGLQKYIRNHCRLGKLFAKFVHDDNRFEIVTKPTMAFVCFRLKGSNDLTKELLMKINSSRLLHLSPSEILVQGKTIYIIRMVVCYQFTTDHDMENSWNIISQYASDLLKTMDDVTLPVKIKATMGIEHESNVSDDKQYKKLKGSFFTRMVSNPKVFDNQPGKSITNFSQDCSTESNKEVNLDNKYDIHSLRTLASNGELKEGSTLKVIVKFKNQNGEKYYSFIKKD